MNVQELIYRPPRISPTPLTSRNVCPFCHASGFTAPGPCPRCGTAGYIGGEPPAYRRDAYQQPRRRDKSDDRPDLDLNDHPGNDFYEN